VGSEASESTPVVPHDHIVFTDLDGAEGVLVDLNAKSFYRLNETAMLVWREVENRATVEEIINKMTLSYDVSTDQAASSVDRLLKSFRTYKLVS
jgi:hypothetical protein